MGLQQGTSQSILCDTVTRLLIGLSLSICPHIKNSCTIESQTKKTLLWWTIGELNCDSRQASWAKKHCTYLDVYGRENKMKIIKGKAELSNSSRPINCIKFRTTI